MSLTDYDDAVALVIDVSIANARTVVPGKVSALDSDASRETAVTFDAGIGKRQGADQVADGSVPKAPVMYPGGGGFSMRWPLDAGDEALALVSDRSIEQWRRTREPGQAPGLTGERHHSLSDALVLPVRMTAPDSAPSEVGDAFVLSGPEGEALRVAAGGAVTITRAGQPATLATLTLDSNGSIVLTPAPGQTVEAGGSADLVLAQPLTAAMDSFIAALVAAGSGPAYAGAGAAQTAWNAAKATIATVITKGA